ncbi:hypothetical protein NDU88_004117, partial [Pleurodeles waltl]
MWAWASLTHRADTGRASLRQTRRGCEVSAGLCLWPPASRGLRMTQEGLAGYPGSLGAVARGPGRVAPGRTLPGT